MKIRNLTAVLALLGILAAGTVLAQEERIPRISVAIIGDDIASNDILFQYANSMDLKGIDSLAKSHESDMISYADLISKLPSALKGWTAGEPTGMNMEMIGDLKYSFAQNDYEKNGAEDSVSVTIYDSVNQAGGPWFGLWAGWGFQFESTDAYARSASVGGYKGWETRDKKDNSGFLVIGLGMGTQVPEFGHILWIAAGLVPLILVRKKMAS